MDVYQHTSVFLPLPVFKVSTFLTIALTTVDLTKFTTKTDIKDVRLFDDRDDKIQ